MMKKLQTFLSLALLATTPAFVACSDDDDDNKFDYKELTLITDFEADFEYDFLQLCDVTITATDFNGNVREINLDAPDWEDKLQSTVFPATCSYKINITRKPGVTLTQPTYHLDCDLSFEADSYLGSRETEVVNDDEVLLSNAGHVPAAQVDAELNRIISKTNNTAISYTFSKSGTAGVTAVKN